MRPIKLSITGLNSYIEEQSVDFEKLCSKGFFGIFGPTGCGKSTILDAITVSLYGATGMARETKDFINTEVDKAIIKYTFSLGKDHGKRTYEVSRSFKNSKTGINNDMAKVVVKDHVDEVIEIYDKPKDVNQFIEELLGLKAEDFMRSVVLPQGKFSEFLKLKDSERRRMIERLLNLQEFGIKLTDKIKKERDSLKNRLEYIEGSIKALAPEELDFIDTLEEELKAIKEDNESLINRLNEKRSVLDARKLIYIKTKELNKLEDDLKSLELLSEEIDKVRDKVFKGKEAQKIEGVYNELQNEILNLSLIEAKLNDINIKYDDIKIKLEDSKNKYDISLEKKEKEYPILLEKRTRLQSVLVLHEENKENEKLRDGYRGDYKSMKSSFDETEKSLTDINNEIFASNQRIKELEVDRDKYTVSREIKDMAYDIKNKSVLMDEEQLRLKESLDEIARYIEEENNLKSKSEDLRTTLAKIEQEVAEATVNYDKLSTRKEMLSGEVLEQKSNELKLSIDIDSYESKLKERKVKSLELEKLMDRKSNLSIHIKDSSENLTALESSLDEVKRIAQKNRLSIALKELSEKMEVGHECPLCGSKDHPHIYVHEDIAETDIQEESVLADKIKLLNDKHIGLNKDMEIIEIDIQRLELELKEISDYSDEGLNKSKSKYVELKNKLSENSLELGKTTDFLTVLKEQKPKQEGELNSKKEEYRTLLSNLDLIKHKIETSQKESSNSETKIKELSTYILESLEKLGYKDKDILLKDIDDKENKLISIDKEQKELREAVENNLKKSEYLSKEKEKLSSELTILLEKGKALSTVIENNNKKIKDVTSGDPVLEIKDTEKLIDDINKEYESLQNEIKVNKSSFDEIDKERSKLLNSLSILKERVEALEKRVEGAIESSVFEDLNQFKSSIVTEDEINLKEKKVIEHDDYIKDLKLQIRRLIVELGDDRCGEEEFRAHSTELLEIEEQSKEKSKELNILSTKIEHLKENRKKLEGVLKEKRSLSDRLGLVMEISKMIQGNRFVEFVSMNHLKYIAVDASNRLMDITSGRYSLEMDFSGGFVICDNYNGGVKRSCQTLSGGETFMTSLSLALALSTHIQLKGSTALEFFILDEGFGTLDSDLLDTVMTSLEKLRTKNISVGVISHVDELKNRVPVKLNVEPAVAGLRGTNVMVEVS